MNFFRNPGWQQICGPIDIGYELREPALELDFLKVHNTF